MKRYDRVYNFAAGPSMMPIEVLERAQAQIFNYDGTGESVMEMSHRSSSFSNILNKAEEELRELMNIPDNYHVLFIQGGGTLQFSMVPLNLMRGSGKADYIITGNWAKKAYKEAEKFGDIRVAASSEDENFTYIPKTVKDDFRSDADYVYVCYNNTIFGTAFPEVPDTGGIPLVADMSSCILSQEINVEDFGLIFAGAQKNIGPAGVTVVIIRDDLAGRAAEDVPVYLDYATHIKKSSTYNTPPCFSIYMAGLGFKYLLDKGGVAAAEERNRKKADLLYGYIDQSELFRAVAERDCRSLMNVTFVTGDPDTDKEFVDFAKERGLTNLKGHRSVGGIRASIYNAMPVEGVETLIGVMKEFETEHFRR